MKKVESAGSIVDTEMLGHQELYRTVSLPVLFYIANILCQRSQFLCLTIDNRLTVVVNDCYSRISIGSKLSDPDVAFQFTVTSLTECEEQCSKRGNNCNAFSFGVGVKGNGTCSISNETSVPLENLQTHPDYDVYVKKQQLSPWCDFDYLNGGESFAFGNGSRSPKTEHDETNNEEIVTVLVSSTLPTLISQLVFLSIPPRSKEDTTSYKLRGIYDQSINHHGRFLSGDDSSSRNRILDSFTNRNERTASSKLFVNICHRKVQAGRKMIKVLIERLVNCENVQDCCRACANEKSFACKGFNHRRRTDNSQCVCELTSTPYSRMETGDDFLVDTDYDYYEREENCLPFDSKDDSLKLYERIEQNTWLNQKGTKGDGFQDWSTSINRRRLPPNHRGDYPRNREDNNSGPTHGSAARFREQFHYKDPPTPGFVSRKNTQNWNDNWKEDFQIRHSDFTTNQNSFAGYPFPSYHKGSYTDLVRSPSFIKPPLRDGESSSVSEQNGLVLSNTNEYHQARGRYLNYGNAIGYHHHHHDADNDDDDDHDDDDDDDDVGRDQLRAARKCSIRVITGSKLSRNVLRKTCLTHDFDQCEQLCINDIDFPCESFSYRYNVLITNPTDNCLLSDRSYENINFYTELEPDRDYNSYIVIRDPKKLSYPKQLTTNRYPLEECFSRIRNGFAIPTDITKKLLFVNDLGECQFACTTSQEFICKSLVFKYATDYLGHIDERESSNCFLTDWPLEEINPADMPDMDGAELYERSGSPYGCETHSPLPLQLSISNIISPGNTNGQSSSVRNDELCYFQHHRPCKLMPHAIVSSTRTTSKPECREKCSATRRNTGDAVISCMSFNYIANTADNTGDNCFLSDISMQDLRPNLDYTYNHDDDGDDHLLYMWNDFDPYCSLTMDHNFHPINVTPEFEQHHRPYWSTAASNQSGGRTRLFNNDIPISIHHSVTRGESKYQFEPYQPDFERDPAFYRSRELSSTFQQQRYTVNGYPCKNATVCQRNEITGFWSCEIEQAEHGSWDYCCEPNHRCGFSRGYHYPWCFVGLTEDQWRPCSETYYPYYLLRKNHSFHRQSPTYIARHWPMIYFHEISPPNCSLSNSNNRDLNQNYRSDYRISSRENPSR